MPKNITSVSWAAENLPSGLSFDTATGTFSGTPDAAGEYDVPVTVMTNYGSDSETVKVVVISRCFEIIVRKLDYNIHWLHQLRFANEDAVSVQIVGDGHFTNAALEEDLGTELEFEAGERKFYFSPGSYAIRFYNPTAITKLDFCHKDYAPGGDVRDDIVLDLSALGKLTNLKHLDLSCGSLYLTGKLSDLSGLTGLTYLDLGMGQPGITGSLSDISGLTGLAYLDLTMCYDVTGDASTMNSRTALETFNYKNSGITGTWTKAAL